MGDGTLPNFRSFFEASHAFTTIADAAPPALEPWIQWYSLHTGLSYQQHRVFRLTDGPQAGHPDIWEVIRNAGLTVFNCSSMNAKSFASSGSLFIPDPWCTSESAYPKELNRFQPTSQSRSRSTRTNSGVARQKSTARSFHFC
jgi:hypothetical protein